MNIADFDVAGNIGSELVALLPLLAAPSSGVCRLLLPLVLIYRVVIVTASLPNEQLLILNDIVNASPFLYNSCVVRVLCAGAA